MGSGRGSGGDMEPGCDTGSGCDTGLGCNTALSPHPAHLPVLQQEAVASRRAGVGDTQSRHRGDSGEDSPGMGTSWGWRSRGDGRAGTCVGVWRFGVLIPLLSAGALRVSQEPAELRVAAGTDVSLRCQLELAEPWSQVRVSWLRDGGHEELCDTRLRPEAAAEPCATPRLHLTWSPPHANLSLRGVREGDAGCYVCHVIVEIPPLTTATGNGTLLRVGAGADVWHGADLMWKLGGGVGGTLLLLVLISLGCWRCRRRADTSDIYVNIISRRTPRSKSAQGAAAGGQIVQGGLDRVWTPPSPKG
ncbi:transmembrane and immunoglobulin domain-containing protein 2 isoform X2 [Numida meleagris]|uniref:transmembrane and immunoglobulin domain-containing protein 2 isoform X2 n=1 Tax=Numida meleagris TaxID=8996 RepID=UPI000B3DB153|nr:transmembrane and immunoglobulin domain-containing protein 2 isoform X2 [Numida meleagris]